MALDRIRLAHLRNHADTALDGTGRFNLLIGENGAGKTNLLEALSLFAPGRGLRRAPLAEIAAHGAEGFAVSAELEGPGPHENVRLGTGTRADRPGRRVVQVNGAEASAVSLSEWLGIAWLTPAMDRLFVDGAGERRRFLDRLALALEPGHAAAAARYEAALRERNRLMADPATPDPRWLDGIEAQLAEAGARVAGARARLVERLNAALAQVPPAPFARPDLAYVTGGPVDAQALAAGRAADRTAGRTLVGPHRDELAVRMAADGTPAARCSTGEQKAMLIAIVLAHAGLGTGTPRLLLLDEVAAHLDATRRAALFERLADGGAQVWMTGTEAAPFAAMPADAAVWHVAGGAVKRI